MKMRNYFLCFLFFGVWSSWQNSQHKWQLRTYSLLSIATMFSSYLIAFFINRFAQENTLSTNIANSSFFIMLIVHSVIAIETFAKYKVQEKVLQHFSFIDQLFNNKLCVRLPYHEEKWEILCRIMMLVFLILLKFTLCAYTDYLNPVLKCFYCTMYSSWVMRLRLIQMTFFVYTVRSRLMLINSELSNIRNTISATDYSTFGESFDLNRLNYLKQAYETLHEIYELLNSSFGYSLLAIVTQNFLDFTSNCYWVFLLIGSPNVEVLLICIVLLIPNVITLSTLAFYCSSCSQCKLVRTYSKFHEF